MGMSNAVFSFLSKLGPEDLLLLAVALILLIERQCDGRFILFLLLIFMIELPKGLLTGGS